MEASEGYQGIHIPGDAILQLRPLLACAEIALVASACEIGLDLVRELSNILFSKNKGGILVGDHVAGLGSCRGVKHLRLMLWIIMNPDSTPEPLCQGIKFKCDFKLQ